MAGIQLTVVAAAGGEGGKKSDPVEHRFDQDTVTLGRDKACSVVLSESSVSRQHVKFVREGALWFVEDLGSAYGTKINGTALTKNEKRLLRNGDVLVVGAYDVTFQRQIESSAASSDEGESTNVMARAVVKDVMRGLASGAGPTLRIMNGPKEGQKFELPEAAELVVGRADECDILLDDDLTSRRHAKFRRDWAGTHVEDLGSRNGVKVNKKAITGAVTLKDRDEVEVGGTRLLFVDPSELREMQVPGLGPALGGSDTSAISLPEELMASAEAVVPSLPKVAVPKRRSTEGVADPAPERGRTGRLRAAESKKVEAPPPPVDEPEPMVPSTPSLSAASPLGADDGHESTNVSDAPVIDQDALPPEMDEPGDEPPGGGRKLPFAAPSPDQLRRMAPLLVVGGVAVVGVVLLLIVLLTH